ncbi:MAG: rhodanese-like domain-containing protein [Balneolaceae bacterium]|nr:rhodanese-like domain-containing protein [Balneolaceae bacterium]
MKLTNILPTIMGLDSISPEVLNQNIAAGSVVVFDVNSRQSWMENHVPGATNLDPLNFTEGDLPADKSSLLVFYCSNPMCRKAPNAARKAKKMEYSNVHVMSAGISGWISAGLSVENGSS